MGLNAWKCWPVFKPEQLCRGHLKSEIEFSGDVDFTGSGDLPVYVRLTITEQFFEAVATIISPDPTNGTFITGHFYGRRRYTPALMIPDLQMGPILGRFISKQTVITAETR